MDQLTPDTTGSVRGVVVIRRALVVEASLLEEIHELIDHAHAMLAGVVELSQRTSSIGRQLESLAGGRDEDEVEVLHEQTGYWGLLAAWSQLATSACDAVDVSGRATGGGSWSWIDEDPPNC